MVVKPLQEVVADVEESHESDRETYGSIVTKGDMDGNGVKGAIQSRDSHGRGSDN